MYKNIISSLFAACCFSPTVRTHKIACVSQSQYEINNRVSAHTKLWVSRPYSNGKNSPCAPRLCLDKRINNKEYRLAGINHFTGIIGRRCSWSKIDQLAVYVVRNGWVWETEWARQRKQDRAWKTAGEMGISRSSKIYPEGRQTSS